MENGVRQDGERLLEIAEEIRANGDSFKSMYQSIFDEMDTRLGAEESGSRAWWGPQATRFNEAFGKKIEEFEKAFTNITEMADNLENQANAWNTFES